MKDEQSGRAGEADEEECARGMKCSPWPGKEPMNGVVQSDRGKDDPGGEAGDEVVVMFPMGNGEDDDGDDGPAPEEALGGVFGVKGLVASEPKADRSEESPGGECAKKLDGIIPDGFVIAGGVGVIEAPELKNFGINAIDQQRPGGSQRGENEPAPEPEIVADAL